MTDRPNYLSFATSGRGTLPRRQREDGANSGLRSPLQRRFQVQPRLSKQPESLFPDISAFTYIRTDKSEHNLQQEARALSRARLSSNIRDLRKYQPQRLSFDTVPIDEMGEATDDWYEHMNADLFMRVRSFASTYFGKADVFDTTDPRSETTLWLQGRFPKSFIDLVTKVARGDMNMSESSLDSHGWEQLLLRPKERAFLITGMLGKILETDVMDELLFGATHGQKIMLQSLDRELLNADGYMRTYQRSLAIKLILASPNHFSLQLWPEIERVALKIMMLLLPLIKLQSHYGFGAPLTEIYQDIHDIVAEAAFISLNMRRSATIFLIDWPLPGDWYNSKQEHVDDAIFNASREAAEALDEHRSEETTPPSRCAKVQIILWPNIQRYRGLGSTPGVADGEKVTTLTRAQMVYYYGLRGDEGEAEEARHSLQAHIDTARKRRFVVRMWFSLLVIGVVFVPLLLVWMIGRYYGHESEIGGLMMAGWSLFRRCGILALRPVSQYWHGPFGVPVERVGNYTAEDLY